ncbi:hypothetical protein SNEBB_002148 [Seison nebaliae]|nr:hypothetical protein SNEBB_002148 [Seison nebaliae]
MRRISCETPTFVEYTSVISIGSELSPQPSSTPSSNNSSLLSVHSDDDSDSSANLRWTFGQLKVAAVHSNPQLQIANRQRKKNLKKNQYTFLPNILPNKNVNTSNKSKDKSTNKRNYYGISDNNINSYKSITNNKRPLNENILTDRPNHYHKSKVSYPKQQQQQQQQQHHLQKNQMITKDQQHHKYVTPSQPYRTNISTHLLPKYISNSMQELKVSPFTQPHFTDSDMIRRNKKNAQMLEANYQKIYGKKYNRSKIVQIEEKGGSLMTKPKLFQINGKPNSYTNQLLQQKNLTRHPRHRSDLSKEDGMNKDNLRETEEKRRRNFIQGNYGYDFEKEKFERRKLYSEFIRGHQH